MIQGHREQRIDIKTRLGHAGLDLALGQISALQLFWEDRTLAPLHFAPWRDDPQIQRDQTIPLVERRLGGDFLCAPFGASDIEPAPAHGWSANSSWSVSAHRDEGVDLVLDRIIFGAALEKRVTLGEDSPVLFQEHVISGGEGKLSIAHHPMVHFRTRARLSVSRKTRVVSADRPLDPGRERLCPGIDQTDLGALPTPQGQSIDPFALPIGDRHEDFLVMVEDPRNRLGWTALVRETEDDIVFVLKDPRALPVTMFWHSNGGRDHAPWNGRHRNVLGIEDGCAAGAGGHAMACKDNWLTRSGIASCIELEPGVSHHIHHVIGAIPRPEGWSEIAAIDLRTDSLVLTDQGGGTTAIPFRTQFFQGVADT